MEKLEKIYRGMANGAEAIDSNFGKVNDNFTDSLPKNNQGWYEERLDDNYYRWSKVVVHSSIDITNGYRTNFYISDAITIPAPPTGVTFDIKSVAVGATSNTGTWVFPDGGNTYRLINTASTAKASVRVIITTYGTKS